MANRTQPPLHLYEAQDIAAALVEVMRPHCDRIEIAGSIRRKRPTISDIEIVCIPRWEDREVQAGLFTETIKVNLLYDRVTLSVEFEDAQGRSFNLTWIKTGVDEAIPWQVKKDGKYWRGSLAGAGRIDYVRLDLFLVSPDTWPVLFTIRTGSRDFSEALVTRAKMRGTPVKEGRVINYGKPVSLVEEEDFFKFLGLRWIPPDLRFNEADIHRAVIE